MEDELDLIIQNMVSAGESEDNIALVINSYNSEKKKSTPTSTPQKSVSGTPTGSSGGVNPAFKSSIPSPIPDFNSMESSGAKENRLRKKLANVKVTPENMDAVMAETDALSGAIKTNITTKEQSKQAAKKTEADDYSFLSYAKDVGESGLKTFAKSGFDTPELAYDFVTQNVINPRLEAEGSPYMLKTGDELADDLGLKNIPSQYLQQQITDVNEKIKVYSDKNGGDALSAIQNGNYVGASKLIVGTTIQSAPLMVAVILSGGSVGGLSVMGVSAAATQNSDLKMQHPEMSVKTRINNSVASGVIEATVGSLFTGASGAVVKKIIADKGVEVGSKIIAKSFRGTIEKIVAKNPVVGAIGEIVEESIVEGSHQTKDIISGIRTDYDLHAIGNAGVSSTGMGAVNTLAVYGAKGYVKAKDYAKVKATNKEVFKLRSEIDGGNLSPENKAILGIRADRLEAENKKLLGTEIEKAKALPTEAKTELNALNSEFEDLKSKFDDIDDADDIPENLKPALKEEIRLKASKNQKRKTEILSQNDGLEVNDDFSKFEGVEPDFDLENGKISSLPLKEQNRLNKLAVEQITGGDKTIEYSKEQVSQTANEIYKNEQTPPTPEAQPQAEVPQQAEAEKVEDVVAPRVENDNSKKTDKELEDRYNELDEKGFEYASDDNKEFNAIERELEKREWNKVMFSDPESSITILNNLKDSDNSFIEKRDVRESLGIIDKYKNPEQISDSELKKDFADALFGNPTTWYADGLKLKYAVQESINRGATPESLIKHVEQEFISDGYDAKTAKETTAKMLRPIFENFKNEATPPTNTPTDGNLRIGAEPVGESGIAEQESPVSEGVSKPVDGGEVKGDASLKDVESTTDALQGLEDTTELNAIYKKWYADSTIKNSFEKFKDRYFWGSKYLNEDTREINKHLSQEITDAINKNIDSYTILEEKGKYFIEYGVSKGFDTSESHRKVGKKVEISKGEAVDILRKSVENQIGYNGIADGISEAYHKAKLDGSNPELVKSIKGLLVPKSIRNLPETPQPKSKVDVEVSDLDHAKSQIEKGVLLWNGDSGAERVNLGIPWADIRKGEADIKRGKPDTVPAKRLIEALKTAKEKGGYEYIQGRGGVVNKQFVSLSDIQRSTNEYDLTDLEQKEVDADEYESARKYDEDFNSLTENEQTELLENYENSQDNSGTPSADSGQLQSESDVSKEKEGGAGKKPTTKERISERIKLSDAKIDENSEIVKAKLKAFADMFPSADINPDDYHTNGLNMDAIIDMVAKAAKVIAKGGIVTSEHIKQAIAGYNTIFDDEINPKLVEERINPKKEAENDFKSKSGKKSLLNRAFEGGNSKNITDAIEANGLDYRIENREEAKKRAEDFVNEVGTVNALEAVRSNQVKGAEKAFVYATIVDNLMNEIENATNESDKQELEKIHADLIADLTNEFSQEGTDAGRFISALNDIYNSSTLKYNLSKQIESHKASNNGEISDEVLAKFTEADKRIKELETLIKKAEAKAKVAEDELAIKNVQEDIERKKQLSNKNKSGLTPREQTRKKELSNKVFGRFNDASGLITALADPEFREYLGLVFKQAKGDIARFTKIVVTEIGKGAQKHIPKLFEEGKKSAPGKSKTIKIGKDGKIKIPAQLFRDYVEAGENDIDVIAAKIKEDIADEFPDVDVRDVRDALSNYGKQVNPPKDDIVAEMSRLRAVGKLISAYEDALKGISPLKSGLKRVKPTQQMRELRKEINRLMKENGLDAVDLEKEWASALDKVKSQLKNQIEDLDKQIAAGEKRKIERTTTVLDAEAESLKAVRDAKKQILDDLVGKPELTEEQLIARAEKLLQTSIDKLQKDIADGKIEYNKKPTEKKSAKLEALRKIRKELVEAKNKMREDAGLVEAKRMATAKQRVKNQIEDLKQRVIDEDYSKKVAKPLIDDSELAQLRAEKLRQQEVYDAQKYKDELKNRTTVQKWSDSILEIWNIERIIRATGELSTVLIQGGMLTVSRKFTNPKQLGIIMNKLFTSLGSAKKAALQENLIKAHPKYPLAMKAKLALANTDYKSDVREEQFTGDYANFAWDLPMLLSRINYKFKKTLTQERTVLGDFLLNPIKKATGLGKIGIDKISIKDQWKNANPFRVLERGSTLYMNTLRMEEFARGVEMLEMEGKNEIDHLADYKLLANAINSMTGRANLPSQISSSSKALAVVFFSARNAVAVINQVNPIYYGYLHFGSTDGFQMKKTSVANKLAVTNFMRFVTITGAMILAIKAGAGDDDEGKEVVEVELDPRSSDFMKIKIGNIRFDPWHGMTGPIVLMAKVLTEEVKNVNSGKVEKLEDKGFGDTTRLDLIGRFARNKLSPSAARLFNTLDTNAGIDPETGEAIRVTKFGENYETDAALANVKPMYWDAVKEIQKENPGALAEFLTVISTFGWNTAVYGQKEKDNPEKEFLKDQEKKRLLYKKPENEKVKIRVSRKLKGPESDAKMLQNLQMAQKKGLPYFISMDAALTKQQVKDMDLSGTDESVAEIKRIVSEVKAQYGIED